MRHEPNSADRLTILVVDKNSMWELRAWSIDWSGGVRHKVSRDLHRIKNQQRENYLEESRSSPLKGMVGEWHTGSSLGGRTSCLCNTESYIPEFPPFNQQRRAPRF